MNIKNKNEVNEAIKQLVLDCIEKAATETANNIVSELPKGSSSSIAKDIEITRDNDSVSVYVTNIVWDYLDLGTGIYNPSYAGQGPGGEIVPINTKALHFKNREIATALGFNSIDVFLKSVKGIKPRYYFDRHFDPDRFSEVFTNVNR